MKQYLLNVSITILVAILLVSISYSVRAVTIEITMTKEKTPKRNMPKYHHVPSLIEKPSTADAAAPVLK